jgi:hypothetical protein
MLRRDLPKGQVFRYVHRHHANPDSPTSTNSHPAPYLVYRAADIVCPGQPQHGNTVDVAHSPNPWASTLKPSGYVVCKPRLDAEVEFVETGGDEVP